MSKKKRPSLRRWRLSYRNPIQGTPGIVEKNTRRQRDVILSPPRTKNLNFPACSDATSFACAQDDTSIHFFNTSTGTYFSTDGVCEKRLTFLEARSVQRSGHGKARPRAGLVIGNAQSVLDHIAKIFRPSLRWALRSAVLTAPIRDFGSRIRSIAVTTPILTLVAGWSCSNV